MGKHMQQQTVYQQQQKNHHKADFSYLKAPEYVDWRRSLTFQYRASEICTGRGLMKNLEMNEPKEGRQNTIDPPN